MKSVNRKEIQIKENENVVIYLDRLALGGGIVHPDVEDRMRELSGNLNNMVLRRYKNSIIIFHTESKIIVAAAYGTAYSLRAGFKFINAVNTGSETIHKWSDGSSLDVRDFGKDWVVGDWHKDEANWINSKYA